MLAATRSSDRVSAAGNPDDPLAALNAAQKLDRKSGWQQACL